MDFFLINICNFKAKFNKLSFNQFKSGINEHTIYYFCINRKYMDKIINSYLYIKEINNKNRYKTKKINKNNRYVLLQIFYNLQILIKKCYSKLNIFLFNKNIFNYFTKKVFNISGKSNKDAANHVVIYSNNIKAKKEYVEYLNEFFSNKGLRVLKQENTIIKNDIRNIDEYVKSENINMQDLKILWLVKDSNQIDIGKLFNYIEKYKFVDILKLGSMSILTKKIIEINKQYGTSIDVFDKIDLSDYNVYINFDLDKIDIDKYVLNKESKYIDLKDSKTDKFNQNYLSYIQGSNKLNFFNIENTDDFDKLDLGYIIKYLK